MQVDITPLPYVVSEEWIFYSQAVGGILYQ